MVVNVFLSVTAEKNKTAFVGIHMNNF